MDLIDFTTSAVDKKGKYSNLTMFMIMLGFTFFSASMWIGQQLAEGLDFKGFLESMIFGGAILGAYTGALGYIGAKSGLSFDLLARNTYGEKGSFLPSAIISFTQIGWFGVGIAMFAIPVADYIVPDNFIVQCFLVGIAGICMTITSYYGIKSLAIISYIAVPAIAILGTIAMFLALKSGDKSLIEQFSKQTETMSVVTGMGLVIGSFISGGTLTPDFSRFIKNGKSAILITVIAFFIGNSLMFLFGAISYIYVGGKDIFDVMMNLGLFYEAIIVLGLNIWTTNDNAIYSSSLGLSNIFGFSKKSMVLVSGITGTVLALWLYWNFCSWLQILNCALPPIGVILILDYFLNKGKTDSNTKVKWFAISGVVLGTVVAIFLPFGITSINGMITAAICYSLRYLYDFISKR